MAWNYLIAPPDSDALLKDWENFLADLLTADQSDEGIIYSLLEARMEIARRKAGWCSRGLGRLI